MKNGAFAMIDCLGFKGIWERVDPEILLAKLRKIKETVEADTNNEEEVRQAFGERVIRDKDTELAVSFLSDTVIIGLHCPEYKDGVPIAVQDAWLVDTLCIILTRVLDLFIEEEPPLVMRGCVTFGEFIVEDPFIVGPAVDRAAELMNIANGGFVWLDETAGEVFSKWHTPMVEEVSQDEESIAIGSHLTANERGIWMQGQRLIYYDLPIKNGENLNRYVVNPLSYHESKEEREAIRDRINQSMVNPADPSVLVKHNHTMTFLDSAEIRCAEFFEVVSKMKRVGTRAK